MPHCRNNSKIQPKNRRNWYNRYPNSQSHDRSLFWLGTGTSIKSGSVKLILWTHTSRLREMLSYLYFLHVISPKFDKIALFKTFINDKMKKKKKEHHTIKTDFHNPTGGRIDNPTTHIQEDSPSWLGAPEFTPDF